MCYHNIFLESLGHCVIRRPKIISLQLQTQRNYQYFYFSNLKKSIDREPDDLNVVTLFYSL